MPIGRSAKKSLRKSIARRSRNLAVKKSIREAAKKFFGEKSEENLKKLVSVLDKAAKSGIFHQNKVARLKSRYSTKVVKTKTVEKKKPAKKTVKKKSANK